MSREAAAEIGAMDRQTLCDWVQTRAWSKEFFDRRKVMPTMSHAGVYSSVLHYLRAVRAASLSRTDLLQSQAASAVACSAKSAMRLASRANSRHRSRD
jgi:hypothetical protein